MSLLSAIILPKIEKQLFELEPEIVHFVLSQLKYIGEEVLMWTEKKFHHLQNSDTKQ